MEYIKKEELIKGEIYKASNGSLTFIMKATKDLYDVINIPSYNEFMKSGNFNGSYLTFINATSEEKHWLNECVKLDKFITFEEAMKTFIPEYVEAIQQSNGYTIGKIYKTLPDSTINHYRSKDDKNRLNGWGSLNFKPSTKEAYDAQFVVKEPEFILPEKWYIVPTNETNSILIKYRGGNYTGNNSVLRYDPTDQFYPKCWKPINLISKEFVEITFEQFKKYVLKEETPVQNFIKLHDEIVLGPRRSALMDIDIIDKEIIEPLPQFKVIETIETITKVENNEGNQFFIGDVVIGNKTIQTIESFNYNKAKTNIIAFTNKQSILGNGIGIDKIEHYIEPKTDYKILEYKTEGGISCKAPFLADSHQFYINERCKIYSIKRISDDLIITVGDEVLSKTCGVPNKILSIELINNKIRLYPRNSFYNLEDIIKVKEETLLEKAKRLYPIGTKFKSATTSKLFTVKDHNELHSNSGKNICLNTIEQNEANNYYGCVHSVQGNWAEIVK